MLLRNTIDAQFAPVIAAAQPSDTWLEDPAILNAASRRRVGETIERIGKEGKAPTRGRVVAGLSFGFWRALFDRKYQQLWVARLHRAFPHGSGSTLGHSVSPTGLSRTPEKNTAAGGRDMPWPIDVHRAPTRSLR